ncbi:MAG TPA: D-2-hydroxyacid dehydrogenase [Candidatus Binatia bacterium]
MRIVVLDGYTLNPGDNPWDELAALGDLQVHDRSARDEVVPRARGAEIVLTNKTVLDRAVLEQLPELRFIAVLATGYNVVDVAAARERGVLVSNVPEYGTDSVAQHTLALLLELAQRVGEHDAAVHAGEWQRCPDFSFWHQPPLELAGLTCGIVGFGRIGRRVGELVHALGMRVVASARPGGAAREAPAWPDFAWLPVEELFAQADVVTLHCPLTADNARFVDDALLGRMKRTALLINTARGALVDEHALARALREGTIAGAALDVVSEEPIRADNPLLDAPNLILTPHMAWASLAARRRLMATTVANVRAFLAGSPINLVG